MTVNGWRWHLAQVWQLLRTMRVRHVDVEPDVEPDDVPWWELRGMSLNDAAAIFLGAEVDDGASSGGE